MGKVVVEGSRARDRRPSRLSPGCARLEDGATWGGGRVHASRWAHPLSLCPFQFLLRRRRARRRRRRRQRKYPELSIAPFKDMLLGMLMDTPGHPIAQDR